MERMGDLVTHLGQPFEEPDCTRAREVGKYTWRQV